MSDHGQIVVNKLYKKGKVLKGEETETEKIETPALNKDALLAQVQRSVRLTINLGNFQSVQVGCEVTLPCYLAELEDASQAAQEFADQKVDEIQKKIEMMKNGK